MDVLVSILIVAASLMIGMAVKKCIPHRVHEPIEETVENYIEDKTGIEVEFCPEETKKDK